MKDILAENMLRFGVKNLTEISKQHLLEQSQRKTFESTFQNVRGNNITELDKFVAATYSFKTKEDQDKPGAKAIFRYEPAAGTYAHRSLGGDQYAGWGCKINWNGQEWQLSYNASKRELFDNVLRNVAYGKGNTPAGALKQVLDQVFKQLGRSEGVNGVKGYQSLINAAEKARADITTVKTMKNDGRILSKNTNPNLYIHVVTKYDAAGGITGYTVYISELEKGGNVSPGRGYPGMTFDANWKPITKADQMYSAMVGYNGTEARQAKAEGSEAYNAYLDKARKQANRFTLIPDTFSGSNQRMPPRFKLDYLKNDITAAKIAAIGKSILAQAAE